MNDEEDEAGKMKRNMLLILKLGTQKTGNNTSVCDCCCFVAAAPKILVEDDAVG